MSSRKSLLGFMILELAARKLIRATVGFRNVRVEGNLLRTSKSIIGKERLCCTFRDPAPAGLSGFEQNGCLLRVTPAC